MFELKGKIKIFKYEEYLLSQEGRNMNQISTIKMHNILASVNEHFYLPCDNLGYFANTLEKTKRGGMLMGGD